VAGLWVFSNEIGTPVPLVGANLEPGASSAELEGLPLNTSLLVHATTVDQAASTGDFVRITLTDSEPVPVSLTFVPRTAALFTQAVYPVVEGSRIAAASLVNISTGQGESMPILTDWSLAREVPAPGAAKAIATPDAIALTDKPEGQYRLLLTSEDGRHFETEFALVSGTQFTGTIEWGE
jgi:hypothetical protein